MDFAISGVHLNPLYLAGVGFVVGILGGFFGVGGSFIAGPALFAAGVPMNFVVGTDLAHIVGKSIVAAKKHRALGNVDFKLGLIMVVGTIAGVEAGAQIVQHLKRLAKADVVIACAFVVVLVADVSLHRLGKLADAPDATQRAAQSPAGAGAPGARSATPPSSRSWRKPCMHSTCRR